MVRGESELFPGLHETSKSGRECQNEFNFCNTCFPQPSRQALRHRVSERHPLPPNANLQEMCREEYQWGDALESTSKYL